MARFDNIKKPNVVIVGGSTSSMSCAKYVLQGLDGVAEENSVTVLHRRALSVFYHSQDAARAEGYGEFDADDICPVSGFVHRFGGFRFDSRDLVKRLLGIGGALPEKRIALHRLREGIDEHAWSLLDNADLVIACLGYRPLGATILDTGGNPITLYATSPDSPMVNAACGLLGADGREIAGLFGLGLAAGYRPPPEMGGERSFSGQVNGLWLWQNDVGRLAISRLLARSSQFDDTRCCVAI